jgi:phosphotransferase system HPr-like phosphotransfer protein
MPDETPQDKPSASPPPASGEMSREEKIAAAKAKAEALKAQRAAQAAGTAGPGGAGTPAAPGAPPAAGAAPAGATARPAAAAARPAPAVPSLATSENPGGQPVAAPQNPKVQALGTINQSVELRCEATEDQNMRRLLGGLGAYRNPLRNAWQVDYRYYAEALKRLTAAGYQIEGKDYLGRPLDQWAPARRGWTRIPPS